jgi:asparagine synthase (glutamine-hydrolysing)
MLPRMLETIRHRGPDDEGQYLDDDVALGQRRLSIIDLDGGQQPIANEDGDIHLICNGEIYNSPALRKDLIARGHRFRTASDCEVILHLYEEMGRECVRHLRGMFALALWDRRDKSLFLARDHLGQKPLFYTRTGDGVIFASEVKAILAAGVVEPEIDLDGLWHYVGLRFIPDHYSLFKRIHKLPAATTAVIRDGSIDLASYWSLDFRAKRGGSERQLVDELDDLLRETIGMHLLSDVRVGTLLSGGIDSGVVTAIMADMTSQPVPSFSIGVHEQSHDELPYARMIALKYGLEAHEERVSADLVSLVPRMVRHMDEPADPFGVGVYLASQSASRHVKVVMGGDGGDENFAGYDRFLGQRLADYFAALPVWFRRRVLRHLIARVPETFAYKSLSQKLRWLDRMSDFDAGERYSESMSFHRFSVEARQRLFTPLARSHIADEDSLAKILKHFNSDQVEDVVDRMLNTDLMTRIPDHLLMTVDRMSMAHSIEIRSPLLDHRVVEFAAALPANLKLRNRELKYILRQVAKRYLPAELVRRPKQGFGFPLGSWMRQELRPLVIGLLGQSRFVERGLFDRDFIREITDEHISGQRDHSYRLWALLNLELWYRINFERETPESLAEMTARLRRDGRDALMPQGRAA